MRRRGNLKEYIASLEKEFSLIENGFKEEEKRALTDYKSNHIIKIETAKNGGNVKEVMEIRLRSKLKSVLILQYLKILCIIGIEVKLDAKNL